MEADMNHATRCMDGRLMRSDPQHDDPFLETDIGECPECDGDGCPQQDDLADRLDGLGAFETYRGKSNGPRSAQVWLTEAERDLIVKHLRS
jgi:hypothetical protein